MKIRRFPALLFGAVALWLSLTPAAQAQVYYLFVIYLVPLIVWLLIQPRTNNKRERSLLAPES